ncbi:MAG: hypothetical protein ABRQ23_10165 [Syntrophomonadaceae bacterium]
MHLMWVVYVLLGLLLLVMVLFFLPINFAGEGSVAEGWSGQVDVSWAGGILAGSWRKERASPPEFSLRLAGKSLNGKKSVSPVEPTVPTPPKARSKRGSSSIRPWLDRAVIREALRLCRRIWDSLKMKGYLGGEYGSQDPALTGYIAAFLAVVAGDCDGVKLYPRFEGAHLNLRGKVEGRLIPALVIGAGLRFALSRPIRAIWWSKLGSKIKKNRRRMAYV